MDTRGFDLVMAPFRVEFLKIVCNVLIFRNIVGWKQ